MHVVACLRHVYSKWQQVFELSCECVSGQGKESYIYLEVKLAVYATVTHCRQCVIVAYSNEVCCHVHCIKVCRVYDVK